MKPSETCDVCGQAVATDEAVHEEMSVGPMLCPTAMTFHVACYERAASIWSPDDSFCGLDPDFPEMADWAAGPGSSPR
ncbi:MAG: hypothetical protein M3535_07160 [Actinomycetota bacterium]|nr:hypothetical protein [Actinomycetota bacterium]